MRDDVLFKSKRLNRMPPPPPPLFSGFIPSSLDSLPEATRRVRCRALVSPNGNKRMPRNNVLPRRRRTKAQLMKTERGAAALPLESPMCVRRCRSTETRRLHSESNHSRHVVASLTTCSNHTRCSLITRQPPPSHHLHHHHHHHPLPCRRSAAETMRLLTALPLH